MKLFKSGFFGAYYALNKKERLHRNDLLCANPDLNLTIELWNLLEQPMVVQALEIVMPSIKVNKKIYIPMVDTLLTTENINKLPTYEKIIEESKEELKDLEFENIEFSTEPLFKMNKA